MHLKKHLRGKKSLIRLCAFLCFLCVRRKESGKWKILTYTDLVSPGAYADLVSPPLKSFCKKNKGYKTALMTYY